MSKPIPVGVLKFQGPTDAPWAGLSVATSASSMLHDNKSRFKIDYWPWVRHFRVEYQPPDIKMPTTVAFIHEAQVMSWKPVEAEPLPELKSVVPAKIAKSSPPKE